MLSLGRCSARKARQAYATRVLSVRVFSAPFLSDFWAKTLDRVFRPPGLRRDPAQCNLDAARERSINHRGARRVLARPVPGRGGSDSSAADIVPRSGTMPAASYLRPLKVPFEHVRC